MDTMNDFNTNVLPLLTNILNSKSSSSKNKTEIIHIYQNIKTLVVSSKNINNLEAIATTLEQFHQTAQEKKLIPKLGWLSLFKPQDAINLLYSEIQTEIKERIRRLKSSDKKEVSAADSSHKALTQENRHILHEKIRSAAPSFGINVDEDKIFLQKLADEYGFKTVVFAFIDNKIWSDSILDTFNKLDQGCSFFNRCFLIRKCDYDPVAIKSAGNFKVVMTNEILKAIDNAHNNEKQFGVNPKDEMSISQCKNLLKFILNHGPFNIDNGHDTLKQWVDLRKLAKSIHYEKFELDRMGGQHFKVSDKLESFFLHLSPQQYKALIHNTSAAELNEIVAEDDPKIITIIDKYRNYSSV